MSISRKEDEPVQKPEGQVQQKPGIVSRRDLIVGGSALAVGLLLGWRVNEAWVKGMAKASAASPMPEASAAEGTPEPKISPRPESPVARTGVDLTPTITATGTRVEAAQQLTATQTRVPETNTSTSTPLPTRTPTATEVPTVDPTKAVTKALVNSAPKEGDKWLLEHPDGGKTEARLLPDGFIPDKKLRFAIDIRPLGIGRDLAVYKDWETALNTKRSAGPLSGYNYDYNDFCNNVEPAFQCNVQLDMYAWRVFQGQEVEVPGIGRLEGGPRRSVVLVVINLDDSVHPWDPDGDGPVKVKRGFTATGRIFDGGKNIDILERNLSGHWLFRQAYGTPEKSYIGVANSPDNAKEVLLITVQRKQWGFEQDKTTKRIEFQLIRADLVTVK